MSPTYHQILQLQPLWTSPRACSPWPLSLKSCCCFLYLGHSFCTASSPVAHSIPSDPLSRAAFPTPHEHSHPIPHLLVWRPLPHWSSTPETPGQAALTNTLQLPSCSCPWPCGARLASSRATSACPSYPGLYPLTLCSSSFSGLWFFPPSPFISLKKCLLIFYLNKN